MSNLYLSAEINSLRNIFMYSYFHRYREIRIRNFHSEKVFILYIMGDIVAMSLISEYVNPISSMDYHKIR